VVSTIATRWRAVGSHVSAKPLQIERWTPSFQENNMGLYCELYFTFYKQQRIPCLSIFRNRDALLTIETSLSVLDYSHLILVNDYLCNYCVNEVDYISVFNSLLYRYVSTWYL